MEDTVMVKKIVLVLALASVSFGPNWSVYGQSKPQPPKGKSGMVSQTISKTSYVAPSGLEHATEISKRIADSVDVPGLTLVCHLYGSADQGGWATNEAGNCALPYGAKLDTSFRQKAFPTSCSGGGATTSLTPGDVPQGIYLVCDGGYYWAVIPPIHLVALEFDNTGQVVQWGVNVAHLYCGPGGAPNGGCNVKLDIYAKLK